MTVAKGLVDGITFVDAYDPEKPEVKAFVAAYKKETGKEPLNLHGYGYDGIHLVADAIKPRRLDRQGEDPRGDADDQATRA